MDDQPRSLNRNFKYQYGNIDKYDGAFAAGYCPLYIRYDGLIFCVSITVF